MNVMGSRDAPAAVGLLQFDGKQEEHPTEHSVDQQRDPIGRAELAGLEDVERNDRCTHAQLDDDERDHRDTSDQEGTEHRRRRPVSARPLNEPVGDAHERGHGESAAGDVDVPGRVGVARFRDVASGDEDHGGGDRQIDEEDQAPRHGRDQEPADERSQCGRDTAETGPGADGAAALSRGE
jgi:hypothetical protein